MSTEWKRKGHYVQCQTCGVIYIIHRKIPIEETFVKVNCPNCGPTTGLNLGDNEDDIYYFYNSSLDNRYY
jgi:predicted RNA-binding Zn-ribbon protein involved in translation (DUF1610 family)